MPEILSAANFNAASLTAPDVYVVVSPPPALPSGVTTNIGGAVGTASWGPKNQPVFISSQQALSQNFGPITAAAINGGSGGGADVHDLASDLTWALNQAQGSGTQIGIWTVRVTDGTDLQATTILKDTAAANGGTLTALYSGTMGNLITIVLSAGGATGTTTVSLLGFANGYTEVFPNLPNTGFWAALAAALATGISGVRGPSALASLTVASSTNPPALGTFTLGATVTGTDGRTGVTTANLTGSQSSFPYTGAYALQACNPAPSEFWIAGLADATAYASMRTLADAMGAQFGFAFPTGTATATCVSDLQGYGISDYNVLPCKDWLYYFDPVNNVVRLVNPVSTILGRILTLSPAQSPLNKPLYGVVGSERNNPITGVNIPYADPEVGLLNSAGILFATNPVPGGAYWGCRTGVSSAMSSNQVEGPVEFGRMTNFLAYSIASVSGVFVGQLQSQSANDPFRAAVRAAFNSFFQQLANGPAPLIDDWNVVCDTSNNSQASIAAHQCYAYFAVTYLSTVWYFVAMLTGGTTVVTSGSTLSQALQSQS